MAECRRYRLTLGRLEAIQYAITRALTEPAAPALMREPLNPKQRRLLTLAGLWARQQTRGRLAGRRQKPLEDTAE